MCTACPAIAHHGEKKLIGREPCQGVYVLVIN
jgi:hypothetical protein